MSKTKGLTQFNDRLKQMSAEIDLESEMLFASGAMKIDEILRDKPVAFIDGFWQGIEFAEDERIAHSEIVNRKFGAFNLEFADCLPSIAEGPER